MTLDPGIPILTEVINDATALDPSAIAASIPLPIPPSIPGFLLKENGAATAHAAPNKGWDKAQLAQLERDITERVLQDMLGRVDFVLEQRIRDSLSEVLQNAIGGLVIDIRQGLQETLESVITRAVSQEITKWQSSKN